MKILVVAATQFEVNGLFGHFNLQGTDFVQTADFDILITGVGMTATAFALGKRLSHTYSLVLNLGIAGSFDYTLPLGTIVEIVKDEFAELGATDKDTFISIDQLGFGSSKYSKTGSFEHPALDGLPQVNGITVNSVHGNNHDITLTRERLHPITESMEGAAVFYCCAQLSIPCVQVRAISNYVEERNRAAWEVQKAVQKLHAWAISFLTNQ